LTIDEGTVEHGIREEPAATRSQHVVHVIRREPAEAARIVAAALERNPAEGGRPGVVVVVPTVSDAIALAEELNPQLAASGPPLLPLTSLPRARRRLSTRDLSVAGTASDLLRLLGTSALKLDAAHTVVLLWANEQMEPQAREVLDTIFAELPKEGERIAISADTSDALNDFLERWMRRARRVVHEQPVAAADISLQYLVSAPASRLDALRLLLDAIDPPTARVVAFSDEGERLAARAVSALGYVAGDDVRATAGPPSEDTDLLVLFDDPPNADVLRQAVSRARAAVAVVAPSHVARLCALAGPGCTPLTLSDAFQAARSAEDALRDELRGVMRGGAIDAQIRQIEPLCEENDPVRIAAAAVLLMQKERQRARRSVERAAPRQAVAPARPAPAESFARLYLNVGERDGVRRGDLVGAITGETGLVGTQIGRIELRDTHAIVEIAGDVAARVIEQLNGANIRGRRVVAREDRERGQKGPPARGREERGAPRGREERGAQRGREERGAQHRHGAGDKRAGRSTSAARGRKGDDIERVPRATHEAEEWSARGERLRLSRGGPGESDREDG
jgi:ATP-dependent RNA helicase DeaD